MKKWYFITGVALVDDINNSSFFVAYSRPTRVFSTENKGGLHLPNPNFFCSMLRRFTLAKMVSRYKPEWVGPSGE